MIKHTSKNQTKYWTYGKSNLPTIIMIHGFRGTHHGLDLIARKLTGYHIIVPDVPGFGETAPLNSEHNLENYVSWLHSFIKDLKLKESPILLGHSFGSIIAGGYVAKHPKTISKLILVNPVGSHGIKGLMDILTKITFGYYWVSNRLPATLAKKALSSKFVILVMTAAMTKTKDKQLRKFVYDQHYRYFNKFSNPKSVSEGFTTSSKNSVRESAIHISIPTLLIAGAKDNITSVDKQRELVALFPNASLEVIENVGHLTHYETPDEVANFIKKFI